MAICLSDESLKAGTSPLCPQRWEAEHKSLNRAGLETVLRGAQVHIPQSCAPRSLQRPPLCARLGRGTEERLETYRPASLFEAELISSLGGGREVSSLLCDWWDKLGQVGRVETSWLANALGSSGFA